jgi:hypothetical protein
MQLIPGRRVRIIRGAAAASAARIAAASIRSAPSARMAALFGMRGASPRMPGGATRACGQHPTGISRGMADDGAIMSGWTLSDIPWERFDAGAADRRSIALAKAACLVEYNGGEYARYLAEVFADDPAMVQAAKRWGEEERQHGEALRRWCELADPYFDFPVAFRRFADRIRLPIKPARSVRGSRTGELVARCAVECGTSFYYSGLRDLVREPVLKLVCARIASDEFRHYRLFHDHGRRWQEREGIGGLRRLVALIGRLGEGEDDELAFAWHCANGGGPYRRRHAQGCWLRSSAPALRVRHLTRCAGMLVKAVGWEAADRLGWPSALLAGVIRARIRWLAA